jgi:hypothetical protein
VNAPPPIFFAPGFVVVEAFSHIGGDSGILPRVFGFLSFALGIHRKTIGL